MGQFRDEYIMEKINKWVEELHVLSEIAKIEPPAANTCILGVYKHKLNYYSWRNYSEFIPVSTGGITITENERKLLLLAPRLGGLGIPIFEEESKIEYQNYIIILENLCNRIIDQFRRHEQDHELNNKKKQLKSMKNDRQKKDSWNYKKLKELTTK